jgi:hypothetical protein
MLDNVMTLLGQNKLECFLLLTSFSALSHIYGQGYLTSGVALSGLLQPLPHTYCMVKDKHASLFAGALIEKKVL